MKNVITFTLLLFALTGAAQKYTGAWTDAAATDTNGCYSLQITVSPALGSAAGNDTALMDSGAWYYVYLSYEADNKAPVSAKGRALKFNRGEINSAAVTLTAVRKTQRRRDSVTLENVMDTARRIYGLNFCPWLDIPTTDSAGCNTVKVTASFDFLRTPGNDPAHMDLGQWYLVYMTYKDKANALITQVGFKSYTMQLTTADANDPAVTITAVRRRKNPKTGAQVLDTAHRVVNCFFYAKPQNYTTTLSFCGGDLLLNSGYANTLLFTWQIAGKPISAAGASYTVPFNKLDSLSGAAFTVQCTAATPDGCKGVYTWIITPPAALTVETPEICITTVDSAARNYIIAARPLYADSVIMQKLLGVTWTGIKTFRKGDLLEYADPNSHAGVQTSSYRLTSYGYDSCYRKTRISAPGVINETILLQVSRNPLASYNLNWSKYKGIPDGQLLGYYIYKGTSPGNAHIIDTTESLNNTMWTDPDTALGAYYYFVEAIRAGGCTLGQRLKKQYSIRSNIANSKTLNAITITPAPGTLKVQLINNALIVNQPGCNYTVINMAGQTVDKGAINGAAAIKMQTGINIIIVIGSGGGFHSLKVFNAKIN